MVTTNYLDDVKMMEEANEAVDFFSRGDELTIQQFYTHQKKKEDEIFFGESSTEGNEFSMESIFDKFLDILDRIAYGDYSAEKEAREFAKRYCLDSIMIDKAVRNFQKMEIERAWENDHEIICHDNFEENWNHNDELMQKINDEFCMMKLNEHPKHSDGELLKYIYLTLCCPKKNIWTTIKEKLNYWKLRITQG